MTRNARNTNTVTTKGCRCKEKTWKSSKNFREPFLLKRVYEFVERPQRRQSPADNAFDLCDRLHSCGFISSLV